MKLSGTFPVNSVQTLEEKRCVSAYVFLIPFCSQEGYSKKGETNECLVWSAAVTHAINKYPISVLWQIDHKICRQASTVTSVTGCTGHHFRSQILQEHWVVLHKSKVLPWICPKAPAAPPTPWLTHLQETSAMHPGFSSRCPCTEFELFAWHDHTAMPDLNISKCIKYSIMSYHGAWDSLLHLIQLLSMYFEVKTVPEIKDISDAHLSHRCWHHMAISYFCVSFVFASTQVDLAQLKSQGLKGTRTEALEKPAYSSYCCWEQGEETELGSVTIRRHHPHPQSRHCNPRLPFNPLYLHNFLYLHGAGLCVL